MAPYPETDHDMSDTEDEGGVSLHESTEADSHSLPSPVGGGHTTRAMPNGGSEPAMTLQVVESAYTSPQLMAHLPTAATSQDLAITHDFGDERGSPMSTSSFGDVSSDFAELQHSPFQLHITSVEDEFEQSTDDERDDVLGEAGHIAAEESQHPDDSDDDEYLQDAIGISNPNPLVRGSENLGLGSFLHAWARADLGSDRTRDRCPYSSRPTRTNVHAQLRQNIKAVTYDELMGDHYDIQGMNWEKMGLTRVAARSRRRQSYANHVNLGHFAPEPRDRSLTAADNFFRFQKMTIRRDITLGHFQLRSVLACPTRNMAFYPTVTGIDSVNLSTGISSRSIHSRRNSLDPGTLVTALDAAHGLLMGGTYDGQYLIQRLESCGVDRAEFHRGQITSEEQSMITLSGITNHLKLYRQRLSGLPVAAISNNDCTLRVMDVGREEILSTITLPAALNCSAVSPDGRLRVIVGDHPNVLIVDADTGDVLQELSGHRDYSFACDWSPDGRTVATGCQDSTVKIWDARRWTDSKGKSTPLQSIRCDMAGSNSLHFSPLGSGARVLVAAEEADFVNIIDAQTYRSKQTIDIFGDIAGVDFSNEGHMLNVLIADEDRGGILQLERCGDRLGNDDVLGSWLEELNSPRRPCTLSWTEAV